MIAVFKIGERTVGEAPISQDVQKVRERVAGKKIGSFRVYGINSLKTLDPPLDALVGDQVVDLLAKDDVRRVELVCLDHIIDIDLARTGRLTALGEAGAWSPAGGGSMPTGRLIFDDGTGLDFKEPAKTKRVTFAVRRR
ncbi:hypothetical protein AB0J90_29785 [Micromonospora sp. NPDC049523]|uniref:hypothetical protein n=1 Tax=Micromonospora sp. NPDC049523 TaxID=3155921 RepID=UPI00341C2018